MKTTCACGLQKCIRMMLLLAVLAAPHAVRAVDPVDDTVYVPNPKTDWTARVAQTPVGETEPIVLVVHAAKDCIWCARWRGFLAGEGKFKSWAKAHPGADLYIIDRPSIASSESSDDYPQELRWLLNDLQTSNNLRLGTPTFEIYVSRTRVMRSYGLYSWDEKVFPAIKVLDSHRAHPTSSPQ